MSDELLKRMRHARNVAFLAAGLAVLSVVFTVVAYFVRRCV